MIETVGLGAGSYPEPDWCYEETEEDKKEKLEMIKMMNDLKIESKPLVVDNVLIDDKSDRRKELDTKTWFSYNAKLQQKKHIARKVLADMGVLEKKGENEYDHYKYFTEAQYKEVSNKLLIEAQLEIKANLVEMEKYNLSNSKTPIGRIAKMEYQLFDIETGFYENAFIDGEGLDRGDKAGYKAYTGAVKYYLANTFLVPTGDDPEKESPSAEENKNNAKKVADTKKVIKAKAIQLENLRKLYSEEELSKALGIVKKSKLEDLTVQEASSLIVKRMKKEEVNLNE